MNNSYALITGASSGIGAEIAKKLAKKGYNLILTARRTKLLENLANEIKQKHNINVDLISKDLSKYEAPKEIFDFCEENNYSVDFLVNNAGYGIKTSFHETSLDDEEDFIRVLGTSVIMMTKLFLPKTCIYLKHCLNIANSHNTKSNLLDRNIKTVKLLNKINMNFGSPTEYTTYNDVEKKIDYMDYVNTLIPDHNAILSYIKFIDSITSHDLSMQYLINQLEPFNMYDMNSSYYQTLKTFLNKEINLYKNNYSLKKRKFDKLQDFVEKPNYIKLETLLYNKTNNELINSIVKETYNIEECNNSEFISNIFN